MPEINIPELSKPSGLSLGAVIAGLISSFLLGSVMVGLLGLDHKIIHEVTDHREDCDRRFHEVILPLINEVNEDVDELRTKLDERN